MRTVDDTIEAVVREMAADQGCEIDGHFHMLWLERVRRMVERSIALSPPGLVAAAIEPLRSLDDDHMFAACCGTADDVEQDEEDHVRRSGLVDGLVVSVPRLTDRLLNAMFEPDDVGEWWVAE